MTLNFSRLTCNNPTYQQTMPPFPPLVGMGAKYKHITIPSFGGNGG